MHAREDADYGRIRQCVLGGMDRSDENKAPEASGMFFCPGSLRMYHFRVIAASDPSIRSPARGTQWAVAAVLAGLLAVVLVTGYFFVQSLRLEQAQSLAENDAIARGVAGFIQAHEEGNLNILQAYAGRFRFHEAVRKRDRAVALVHLRQIAESFPELDRPFLTDPAGVLWAAYPEAPGLYGRSLAHRDWYQGVSREWRPYWSEVIRGAETGSLGVVLVAPIRDPEGKVIGIIGSFRRLEVLRRWLLPVRIPDGDLYVVDRKGQFVFHRTRTGPDRLADYARVSVVERLLRGEEGVAETENAVEGEVRLSAYRSLPALGWGVVVHRSKNLALQRTRTLILASGTTGLLLVVALGVLGALAIRNQRRTVAALAERSRAVEALRHANAFLDSVVENIPNMIFVKDVKELRFVRFNKAGEELLGYSREDLIGKNVYEFFPREEADFFTIKDREVLNDRKLVDIPEAPYHTQHRGTRILHTKKIPILDEEGRPQYLLGISEDVTELKQAEEALRSAKQEADRANQAKSEFLSRMSHELRTPLNAILGFGQLLEMEPLGPEQQESVQHILKAGRHLLELINEVLDISRIEAGRLTISPEPILLSEFLLEVQDLVQPLAAERNVELEGRATEVWGRYVLADRQRLKQVLLNLLSNAIKFNRDPGTVAVSVGNASGDHLRIKVADTGLGIPPEKMARLFTAFDRLGAEQTGVEGAGLGLALSKRLAELMGGTIGVDSTVGEGSTFWVELPGVEGQVERLERTVEGVAAAAKGSGVLGTVLYIEDNLSNLRLVERILAHRPDVRLLSAMQGRLGLELAREHRPDLIFLDLHLPDVPGGEVLRRLQADGKTRRILVVVISADATSGQIQRLLAEGARDYLTKPLDVKKLISLVDETLRKEGGR